MDFRRAVRKKEKYIYIERERYGAREREKGRESFMDSKLRFWASNISINWLHMYFDWVTLMPTLHHNEQNLAHWKRPSLPSQWCGLQLMNVKIGFVTVIQTDHDEPECSPHFIFAFSTYHGNNFSTNIDSSVHLYFDREMVYSGFQSVSEAKIHLTLRLCSSAQVWKFKNTRM